MGVIVISCKLSCYSKVVIPHCFQNQGRGSEPDIDLDMAVGVLVGTGHLCAYCRTPLLLTTEKKYKSFCAVAISLVSMLEKGRSLATWLYIFSMHITSLHCTALKFTELHHTVLFCTKLCCTTLHLNHCTALK